MISGAQPSRRPNRSADDLRNELRELLENADAWMQTPNTRLGGRRPENLLGTPDEHQLRDIVEAAKNGTFS